MLAGLQYGLPCKQMFLFGNGINAEVSNQRLRDRSPRARPKSLPEKNESELNCTGVPDWMMNVPLICHPPTNKSSTLGMFLPSALFLKKGRFQVGATERWNGLS